MKTHLLRGKTLKTGRGWDEHNVYENTNQFHVLLTVWEARYVQGNGHIGFNTASNLLYFIVWFLIAFLWMEIYYVITKIVRMAVVLVVVSAVLVTPSLSIQSKVLLKYRSEEEILIYFCSILKLLRATAQRKPQYKALSLFRVCHFQYSELNT